MTKNVRTILIIVWSVVCLSGLSAFLFEMLGPGTSDSAVDSAAIAVTLVFWAVVWFVPVAVLFFIGRRGFPGGGDEGGAGS